MTNTKKNLKHSKQGIRGIRPLIWIFMSEDGGSVVLDGCKRVNIPVTLHSQTHHTFIEKLTHLELITAKYQHSGLISILALHADSYVFPVPSGLFFFVRGEEGVGRASGGECVGFMSVERRGYSPDRQGNCQKYKRPTNLV